jgi:serine/threonine protein kinase
MFLVEEYGGANSLYKYLVSLPGFKIPENTVKIYFRSIAETVGYLHERDIVHRDIKAENILLNRYQELKLIDFGFSLLTVPPATIDTFCGTPTYMAPEIVSKKDHVPIYTDIWSMGVLLYVMLQGNYPFRGKNEDELF